MALALKRTVAEMRAEILRRCGYASQGSPSTLQRALVRDWLQEAQEIVTYEFRDFGELKSVADFTTVTGQTLYDWPDGVDPMRRIVVSVLYSNVWMPVLLGIERDDDSHVEDAASFPQRYDLGAQLELWPEPDGAYTVRIEHYQTAGRLEQDDDRAAVPDRLVTLLALYKAKLHYRQPDAAEAKQSYDALLSRMKAGNAVGRRFIRAPRRVGSNEPPPLPRPQRV